MREYVILCERAADCDYTIVTIVEATGAATACRAAAKQLPAGDLEEGVRLVAVPARNWQPVRLQAQTTTRLIAT